MCKKLKVFSVDTGFCRVNYVRENPDGQKVYYCIQEEMDGVFVAYRSSSLPWLEPDYMIHANLALNEIFENPEGTTQLEIDISAWLSLGGKQ
jgi:hypothetical protein